MGAVVSYKTLAWSEDTNDFESGIVWCGESDDIRYWVSPARRGGYNVRSLDVPVDGWAATDDEAKTIAERDYLLRQRKAEWARYMAENDPPDILAARRTARAFPEGSQPP